MANAPLMDKDAAVALQKQVDRAMRHNRAGRYEDALDLVNNLIREHPDVPELLHLKGLNMFELGQHEDGIAYVLNSIEASPENGGMAADLGALFARLGRIEDAIPLFERAADLAPNLAGPRTNLGAACILNGDHAAAIPHLRKAVALDPTLLDAHRNLAAAYMGLRHFKLAVETLYRALAIDPTDPGIHVRLAAALYREERHDSALHHAEKALEIEPQALEAHLHLGNAYASLGQMEKAETHLLQAMQTRAFGVQAMSRLIHIRKSQPDSPEVAMLKQVETIVDELPERHQATAHFAAGKAYFDLGNHAASFDHLHKGNQLTAKEHPFDQQNFREQIESVMKVITPEMAERHWGKTGLDEVAPIFVCGMPRSGTTLVEMMLSQHPAVQAGGEMRVARDSIGHIERLADLLEERAVGEVNADNLSDLAEEYISRVRAEGVRSEVFTDKMPINYMFVGLLALAFPRARFLIMQRHPMDNLLSSWTQDFGPNQHFSTEFKSLGLVYREFRRLSEYWARLFADAVRLTSYEDLVDDAEGEMRAVLQHCDLPWTDAVLEHADAKRPVYTASIGQVRNPLYRSSVGRWTAYGTLLKDLAQEVDEFLSDEDRRIAGLA